MTTDTLPDIAPQQILQLQVEHNVTTFKISGYFAQRVSRAYGGIGRQWDVVWQYLDATDLNHLTSFLSKHHGIQGFRWSPSDAQIYHVVCHHWQETAADAGSWHLKARFETVYRLV